MCAGLDLEHEVRVRASARFRVRGRDSARVRGRASARVRVRASHHVGRDPVDTGGPEGERVLVTG